jgi:hypothetical protein
MFAHSENINEVAAALASVMRDVQTVQRDGENTFQRYKFVSAEQIKAMMRPLITHTSKDGKANFHTRVRMVATFIHAASGQFISVVWSGEGMDTQDKGNNKARTATIKYGLIGMFLLSTQEDIDPDEVTMEPVEVMAPLDMRERLARGWRRLQKEETILSDEAVAAALEAYAYGGPATIANVQRAMMRIAEGLKT